MMYKLGRISPKSRPQCLLFSAYLNKFSDTKLPDAVDYSDTAKSSISRVYLNDRYGDCVIAGKYHAVGVWSGKESGTAVLGTDAEVLSSYYGICGPGDNGCNITDVLDYMKANGLPFGGVFHKIDGYVSVNWTNPQEVKVAIYLFGCLSLGINFPSDWESSQVWDVTNTRIVGGHDVTVVGYNATGVIISTWGGLRTITWSAMSSRQWVEECYALLSPDWYAKSNLAPNLIDAVALRDDLAKFAGGTIPPITPTPIPTPVPVPPVPTPIPVPTPVPVPVPPVPCGLSLAKVNQIVSTVVYADSGNPFFFRKRITANVQAAITKAWPSGNIVTLDGE